MCENHYAVKEPVSEKRGTQQNIYEIHISFKQKRTHFS